MTIWSCKPLALLAICGVTGCGEIGPVLPFLPPAGGALFSGPGLDASGAAKMLRGRVTLVPPEDYCIDPDSLQPDFAILARCDALQETAPAQQSGLITVSITHGARDDDPGRILNALQGETDPKEVPMLEGDLALAQIEGPVPEGTDAKHWRAVGQIGPVLLGMAHYAPKSEDVGAKALRELFARTQQASGEPG